MIPVRSLDILTDVTRALSEDWGNGDATSILLPPHQIAKATLVTREPMIVCGQAWVEAVFAMVNPRITVEWLVQEGEKLPQAQILCYVTGPVVHLLTAERTALNFLQTLSGTATTTHHYVSATHGTKALLLDTRKTIPGLRIAQKYAVQCGGGCNHRMGLYDAYLIKENHILACGSISQAIQRARKQNPTLFLEIEVENLADLQQALEAKPDRILLDNFPLEQLQEAVKINAQYGCALEASGGITLENIRSVAETGVDYISVGDLTKSVKAIDLSFRLIDAGIAG